MEATKKTDDAEQIFPDDETKQLQLMAEQYGLSAAIEEETPSYPSPYEGEFNTRLHILATPDEWKNNLLSFLYYSPFSLQTKQNCKIAVLTYIVRDEVLTNTESRMMEELRIELLRDRIKALARPGDQRKPEFKMFLDMFVEASRGIKSRTEGPERERREQARIETVQEKNVRVEGPLRPQKRRGWGIFR